MTGQEVYREILSLATGTQVRILRDVCTRTLTHAEVEGAMLNFAEWCLDEDGGPFLDWMDAWRRFVRDGSPGTKYAMRQAREASVKL